MTTKEFINKAWHGQTRSRQCSSVFIDGQAIYSYGYHYPLLFKVAGKTIRNVTGYSNSTARHIQWSRDVDAIDINCGYAFRLRGNDQDVLNDLIKARQHHVDSLKQQLDGKKRKDTQVYKWLEYDYNRATQALQELQA